ncbi:hypothetical protein KXV22_006326 [Aspergillus fumigatus]|uniref:Nucleoporin NUP37 n=2 Tax=Aspergillus fumigatus TaxID=746128 RepID=Q4WWI1_ASPFU|nr:conserved hypothetical protein [Aspergillus fumigatus Af293]KAH1757084.1 hypothetical protein KXX09_003639 [Aspergillus fumigatus]EAL92972.1 conserved hypothetical protein [Aspergillus fumigatus Af293]KAH1904644.1 hypothetical protein KXV57_006281 [Aspergillus fumigatus]KAH1928292.1 hypothetical protein KXW47_006103 [Aspergillus fumigatus]KAH1965422.1 hypothetical protein KXV90_005691 [Aspergillus fumigatus]
MPSFPTRPLVKLRDDGLQLSYQLPQRVHAAKAYPILAPNGSSIIVYGYENGLKVIWRGGKRFSAPKPFTQKAAKPARGNSSNDDAVMIIDSDHESAAETPKEEGPVYEFEEDETEVDSAFPFEDILRQIDIPLGSRVLDLAVPRILPETARSSLDPFPPALKKLMAISAVCADYSTRIVTLPLIPPHPTQTELTSWQVQTVSISGGVSHQEVPRGVSISFTCQEIESDEDVTMSPTKSDFQDSERWDLLVATHSAEASGLLLIHRIPIVEDRMYDDEIVSRRVYLPAPATNISFNPSTFPALRHSTLLVAFHSGCVKVYSCFSRKPAKVSRRASGPQSDFEKAETEGRWLISLYPGFEQSPSGLVRRKTIIDAEWVLGGRAIMVLMADGEWGVWDLEGAGPGSTKGPLQRQSSIQGVTGGSLTAFSVSGKIVGRMTGRNESGSESPVEPRPKFAPMTPSTKRVREDTLLKGTLATPTPSLCGEISVYQTSSLRDALPDESILLRHGTQSAVIPSLLSLWRNAIKASGTFDASNRCRVSPIQDIHLMGENFTGISHLPAAARRSRDTERQDFDILITSEHRIIILAPKLTEPEDIPVSRQSTSEEATIEADQLMLRRGVLDVDGMDRLLSGMASGNRSMRMGSPIKRARIFA